METLSQLYYVLIYIICNMEYIRKAQVINISIVKCGLGFGFVRTLNIFAPYNEKISNALYNLD